VSVLADTLRITDDSTRSEVIEALGYLCHRSKREMPVVGTTARPTPWDERHDALNDLLDRLDDRTLA
jgi:hypothetical protein